MSKTEPAKPWYQIWQLARIQLMAAFNGSTRRLPCGILESTWLSRSLRDPGLQVISSDGIEWKEMPLLSLSISLYIIVVSILFEAINTTACDIRILHDFTMCLPFSSIVPCHRSVQNYFDFIGFSSRSPVLAVIWGPSQPARITSPIVQVKGNALKLQAVRCGRWGPKYACIRIPAKF